MQVWKPLHFQDRMLRKSIDYYTWFVIRLSCIMGTDMVYYQVVVGGGPTGIELRYCIFSESTIIRCSNISTAVNCTTSWKMT